MSDGQDPGGPSDRLLSWEKVEDMVGISRTTAWRLQQTGAFPRRVSVSPGRVGWWESELTAWKQARGSARPIDPPTKGQGRKPLEAPTRPRLPGMSRSAPMRMATPAPGSPVQPELPIAQPARAPTKVARRRKPAAHADQTDFGF
jgi:prophage regulatory protein